MKNVAVLTEDGAFALFFRPHPGGFDSLRVPTPENLSCKAKKKKKAKRSWNWLMHNLKKRLTRASTPASDVYERLKTNGKAIKIARDY